MTARRIGSRPGSLPVISKGHSAEPIPVRKLETPAKAELSSSGFLAIIDRAMQKYDTFYPIRADLNLRF